MESAGPTDLRGVMTTLSRRRWLILATAAFALVVGLAWVALTTPTYEAKTEILLEPDVPADDPERVGRALLFDQELETQLRLLTSEVVLARAMESLGLPREAANGVDATLLPDTRVVVVTASAHDPERAAVLASAVADKYLEVRRERATEALTHQRDEAERQVEAAAAEVSRLDQEIAEDAAEGAAFAPPLQAERFSAVQILNDARARLTEIEAGIQASTGGGQVIEPAAVPTAPAHPRPLRTAAVALLLGLGLGVVFSLLRDTLDESVRSDDDAVQATGQPVLARVPDAGDHGASGALVMTRAPESADAEPYRDLRANLRFMLPDLQALTVTSSAEGEGKSTVAANVAVAAALAGFRVALVDGDLRRPDAHRLLGVGNDNGLSGVLVGQVTLDDALHELSAPPLSLLTAGRLPPNPSELLGSQQLVDLIAQLRSRYDLLVIDTPPALSASDALEIAALTDGTLLVARHSHTGRRALREVTNRLERAGARIVGSVVNRVDLRDTAYAYLAHHQPAAETKARSWLSRW